ncbi:MAG: MFS transporter [Alphaproteobacteria bacterium]|nr:MFS transporter [Alphaproteobacteria bacterium]
MVDGVEKSGSSEESFVSWREFLAANPVASLILLCVAVWLHAADSLIVATMLPSMVAEIGGASLVGWSVTLYEIGSIVAGASSALLAMRHGLRLPMAVAAVVFGIGCLVSAAAPSFPVVLAGRLMQGVGGGGLVALGFVAIGVLFPNRYIARAMALISTLWGVSAFLGPLIGGFFVEFATWRWGFAFFGAKAFALGAWILLRPEPKGKTGAERPAAFPLRRLAVLCLGVMMIAYAGVEIELVRTSLLILGGIGCLLAFLQLDARAGDTRLLPMRPMDLRHPTGAALLMILTMAIATIAILAFGPLLVTAIHGVSALTTGYIVAAATIGWSVTAFFFSGLPARFDRLMIALGMTVVAVSIVGFLYAIPNGPIWLIAVCAALEGGGFGLAWTFILRRMTKLADPDEVHRISGALPTVQRLGYAIGAAYIGIVANAAGIHSMATEADAVTVARSIFLACVPFGALGLMAMMVFIARPARRAPGLRT